MVTKIVKMLSTYASSTALKYILLIINSLIFTIGMFVFLHGTVQLIGVEGAPTPYAHPSVMTTTTTLAFVENIRGRDKQRKKVGGIDHLHHQYHSSNLTVEGMQDRFPSVGSASVLFMFGLLIMGCSSLGVTAVHLDDPALLDTFAYVSFISCFIKVLFVVASTQMHAFHYSYNPMNISAVASLVVSVIEIVLGMSSCHLSRLIKRGEPEPEIPPFKSY